MVGSPIRTFQTELRVSGFFPDNMYDHFNPNALNGRKDDCHLTPDKEMAESFKRCYCIVLWSQSSGAPWGAYEGLTWTLPVEKYTQPKTTDPPLSLVSPPTVCVNLKFKQSSPALQESGTMTICWVWRRPQGDRLVNISSELGLNSFQMKTYICLWGCWGYHMGVFINIAALLFGYEYFLLIL